MQQRKLMLPAGNGGVHAGIVSPQTDCTEDIVEERVGSIVKEQRKN